MKFTVCHQERLAPDQNECVSKTRERAKYKRLEKRNLKNLATKEKLFYR